MKMTAYILAGVVALVAVLLGGLLVKPAQFETPAGAKAGAKSVVRTVPIPEGLPAPVEAWYRADYPNGLPVADSMLMSGRGVMRMFGLSIPMRHRVEIRPGRGFLRRMELTWYGMTVLKGRDTFVDGYGKMETPVGPADGPQIDQGADVVNWLEALAVPGVLAQDERVRWEPVDDDTARLVFPFKDGEDSVEISFDPSTHRPATVVAKRFREVGDAEKTGWTSRMWDKAEVDGGMRVNRFIDAQWAGDAKPWATFEYESAWMGAEVPEYDAAAAALATK